jgi:hypothetical protein
MGIGSSKNGCQFFEGFEITGTRSSFSPFFLQKGTAGSPILEICDDRNQSLPAHKVYEI